MQKIDFMNAISRRRNTSTSNRTMRKKFGSTSTNRLTQVLADQQLQTDIYHYGGK